MKNAAALLLCAALGAVAAAQPTAPPLAVVGFEARDLAARDAWVPLALEETLTWRLRRVPQLLAIPSVRLHQARDELRERDDAPPIAWKRVVTLVGARQWLTGRCSGRASKLIVELELRDVSDGRVLAGATLGPDRLMAVIDQATRWTLGQLDVRDLPPEVDRLIMAPPARSPSALEYYAKAVTAARQQKFRDAKFYVDNALNYDPDYRPALMLLSKLALKVTPANLAAAERFLRRFRLSARRAGDPVDLAQYEIGQGLVLMMSKSFAVARKRFETALKSAADRHDTFGTLAARVSLSEYWINVPADDEQARKENLGRALALQQETVQLLDQLHDRVSLVVANNKLGWIHDRLGHDQQALAAYQASLSAAEATGSLRNQATAWLFLGQWHRRHQQWDQAVAAVRRCLELAGDQARPRVRMELAAVERERGDLREALAQYRTALAELESGDDLLSQFACQRAAAELQMELGDRQSAIASLAAAIEIAEALELGNLDELRAQLARWQTGQP